MRYLFISLVLSGIVGCTPAAVQWIDPAYAAIPKSQNVQLLRILVGPSDFRRDDLSYRFLVWMAGEDTDQPSLSQPYAVTADGNGRVWVTDTATRYVHLFDLLNQKVDYITAAGSHPFSLPAGVAYDPLMKRLYVSDALLSEVYVYDDKGSYLGEIESVEGFVRPAGLAVDGDGRLYVADVGGAKVEVFDAEGHFLFAITGGDILDGGFNRPLAVSVDAKGRIFVNDSMNFRVQVFDSQGTYLSSVGEVGDMPGTFARPRGVATDASARLYVSDAAFDNVQVFSPDGDIDFHFGSIGALPGLFSMPSGLFLDGANRLYVVDSYNKRVQIFQILKRDGTDGNTP